MGEDCMIGRNALIYDSAYHPTGTTIASMSVSQSPVHIGNHVWLGANSVIMQGSDIGDGSIIGTNACVSGKKSHLGHLFLRILINQQSRG
ncbi:MAG: hypothetical protein L6V93_05400 [Clostridiales bacterium]|nr:MAG: hypothetical protein L6V93_05400 [Clostridiales bacterium]